MLGGIYVLKNCVCIFHGVKFVFDVYKNVVNMLRGKLIAHVYQLKFNLIKNNRP